MKIKMWMTVKLRTQSEKWREMRGRRRTRNES
jgi:hypothetical protein